MHKEIQPEYVEAEQSKQSRLRRERGFAAITALSAVVIVSVIVGTIFFYNLPSPQYATTDVTTESVSSAEKATTAMISPVKTEEQAAPPVIEPEAPPTTVATPASTPPSAVTVNSKLDPESAEPSWSLNVMSLTNKAYADEHLSALIAAGFAAVITEVMVDETSWLRIHIPGFATADEARIAASRVTDETGYKDTWVSRD